MFKLESYITPILLNYVAKYVKDLRDEDAQVSLWEGEVTFQNLDLRLDVLQEELNLPIELLSGHIHELSIQVPWTKLMSEPVRIVINTIEFVAKLPDEESKKSRATLFRDQRRKLKGSRAELVEPAPPQAGATNSNTVNKIINNINVQCHNIILKYVEDDIVVSMNVQYLSFTPANEKWQNGMVDVHPVNVCMRKLLQISDLTICLDQRNPAGRIDVCQEPVLYRCTLECRVLRKHNINTMSTTSTTRIGVLTKSLDINVSSLQLPMVMRLIKMLLDLKPADMDEDIFTIDEPTIAPSASQHQNREERNTVFQWAWNLLPRLTDTGGSLDSGDVIGHAFDVGVYAEQLNFMLKNSEYFIDQAMGSIKRIKYTPILRISLGGIYYERSQLKEVDWANVRAGLSSIYMEPLGPYRSDDPIDRSLLNTKEYQNERAYIDKSLFDEYYTFADRAWCSNNYDDYFSRITDEYMLFRSPVMAFDIVEYRSSRTMPKQAAEVAASSVTNELKDFGLRVKYRLLSAGITFHFSQSFLQVKNVISDLVCSLNYQGIHADSNNDNEPTVVTTHQEYANEFMTYKDFEYLIGFMPTCNYKIELRDMNVQFYPLTNQASHESLSMLPYLRLRVPLATGSVCGPANPERIVQLITHLQDKPREIVDSCYLTYEFDVKDLTFTALNTSPEQHNAKLINIPRMTFQYNRLLMPEKWRTNVAALESAVITAEIINMEFSKREFLIAQRIILMCISYKPNELAALATAIAETSPSADVIRLQTLISKLRLGYRKYHTHHAMLASVRNINADVHHSVMNVRNVVFSTNKGVTNKWMELQLQFPIPESAAQVDPPPSTVVCLWLESFRLTLDVYLLQFLKSFVQSIECTETETDTDQDAPSERQNSFSSLSVTSAAAFKMSINELQGRRFSRPSRKISIPEETVHASSDRDEKHAITFVVNPVATQAPETAKRDYVALVERLSTVVIFVESAQSRIDVCELMRRKKSEHITMEYTSIQLPRVKIKSNFSSVVSRGNIRLLVNPAIKSDQPFNWILEFNDFIIRYRKGSQTETLMAPVRTTVTLVISQKKLVVPESNDSKQSTDETESQPFSSISSVADLKKVDWANENAETESDKVVTWCVNVHIDMSAICFYGHRLKLLHEHFGILCTMYTSFRMSSYMLNCSKTADNTRLEIYTGSAQNQPLIKEFLELEPATHSPKRNKADKNEETFIFFGQWTIPRISLEMESFGNGKHRRVTLNFEDLLFNVDRHDSFNKVTAKVETLDLNYFTAKSPNEWTQMDSFQINTLGDSSNLPLLNVVITTVSLRDFYQKIGASDLFHKERSITELLIDVQPIEMVLDLDQLTEFCIPLCELLDYVRKNNPYQGSNASRPSQYKDTIKTVQQMPIVHLNSKGIFIYAPLETEKQCCSVLVLQIESIRLTPNLENPLVRQLIRPDIYSKAAELNMLHTPGSLVEDRQYELSVRKISLSSGNWQQTQQHRMAETRANEYDNPAFEWNNQLGSDALLKWDIFKDFDFITVFAPAISYERFLVCGQSIEYNCVSDFVASLNSPQINLISCFIVRVQRLQGILEESCLKDLRSVSTSRANSSVLIPMERKKLHSIMSPPRTNFQTPETKSSETFVGSCQSDSGIYIAKGVSIISSITNSIIPRTSELIVSRRFYPRSISFVAGIFALRLYDAVELEQQLILRPLMLVTISQPSFMTTQNLRKSVTQGSLFDFTVHVPGAQSPPTSISDECFSESVIFTMPGTLGSSGIPSPLLTFKLNRDRHQQKEMDLELLKPLVMRLCESTVRQLISDVVRINTVLHESPCFALRSERPVVHTTPLRQLKLTCFNRDRVNLRCDSLTIKFYDHERTYQFNAILRDFNGNLKFNLRPHKAAVKATLGAFFIQAGDKILLHPLLMRLSADLLSEPWCDQLLICATLKLNVLHVDAGVFTMLHLRKARAGFDRTMEHARLEWSGFLQQRPSLGMPEEVSPELLALYTPSKAEIQRAKLTQKPKVEFYQDDLRAGAFQFVYLNSDNMLPMPYQVQIIKKNYGIICWRYPQPRQMKHIHIYPVPMPVDNPIHIRCRMEYFSETHETFLYYCDFELSEQTSKHINPPERQISANIWRVVIMQSLVSVDGTCFEPDSDEDLQSIDSCRVVHDFKGNVDNDFVLHPKVLVGCMRIDTTFQAELVPKLQFLLACQDIELNLLNQPDAYDVLPPELDSYKLKSTTQISQNFLTLHVSNLQLHTEMYKPTDYSVELNFRSRIKCLDSGFLNMIDVMEPMSFQSYVRYVGCLRKMQANFVLDKLRFNCSACVIQTLYSAKQHWQEVLQQREELHTLMPKCVVVNRLQLPITFGQSGTSERIQLAPQQLRLYHFCSDFHTQELTFYVENPETQQLEASSSVHIAFKFEEEQRVHQLRIGQRCITIKQAKLSATQVYILVKGQIELLSMVPYELLAEFRVEDEPDKEALEHVLAAKGRASFCHQVMRQTNINMRLNLSAGQAKGRTGDIPLKTNNSLPWLVKVPTQSAQQFISLWVRILREDIALTGVQDDFQPQRILVSIWPIFEICNLLNCALQATESSTERPLAIDAAGGRLALSTATTHATEHRLCLGRRLAKRIHFYAQDHGLAQVLPLRRAGLEH
ncbi:vacuolar protein sorting-associated protein 13B isoform X2 [Drosophila busckii]|uniref:vacuolar protein sorting-associated protein 13B isoform X2 n=1 Tax=Drosophila busckii TaxID=30019 RepID=UPI00083F1265|nr:vacuolar protein sorting-associated protein 13B isoform X2 [Drosophila busckii]